MSEPLTPERNRIVQLSQALFVYQGTVNVGIIRYRDRAILVDCGDIDLESVLAELGINHVDLVLVTHHHRDQIASLFNWVALGVQVYVSETERLCLDSVETFWSDDKFRWHLYDDRPHPLMLAESVPVQHSCLDGETIRWHDLEIQVIATPGHTEGSVSYQIDVDGERYIFCGDVLYGQGQLWDVYSLQKGWETSDYHGFMGDRKRLVASLETLRLRQPQMLIPAHGPLVAEPVSSINLLCDRLAHCYRLYAQISALRFYFPDMFVEFDQAPNMMPILPSFAPPDFLLHIGTSWIIRSETGAVFCMDCGSIQVIERLQAMQVSGEVGPIEGLWITHYHDDHVDHILEFFDAFDCPIFADRHVADVVSRPLAWRLPCISPVVVQLDRVTEDSESWIWHEFTLTAYHLPGQTLYHGGLLLEGRGARVFFAGDSFTPGGIDDYCAGNRNLLGQGVGFDASLQLIQALSPDCILNAHVDVGFAFAAADCERMRANLADREVAFGELVPWAHPNFALDPHWIRSDPYEQSVAPGDRVFLDVVFTNHDLVSRYAICTPVLPQAWGMQVEFRKTEIQPKSEGRVTLSFQVPEQTSSRRWIIPISVVWHDRDLGPIREAVIVVE